MLDQDDDRDIITALDGRQVDVTREITRLISVGRYYSPGDLLDPEQSRFLHRFGWGLMVVAGPEMPEDLVDDMLESEEISPDFAAHLRDRWGDLVAQCS